MESLSALDSCSNAELLARIVAAYEERKVMVAGRWLKHLESRGASAAKLLASSPPSTLETLRALRSLYHRVMELRSSMAAESGWEVQRDVGGIRCLYKGHPSGFVKIRLDAEVDAPLFDLLALLREVDLWHTWMPSFAGIGLRDAKKLGETTPLSLCAHVEVCLPWPFTNRAVAIAIDGIDCMNLEDAPQQIAVLLDSSCAQSNCPVPINGLLPCLGVKLVDLWDSGVIITPPEVAGTKHTLMQVIVVVDPKMTIPRWLVNLAVRNFCFLIAVQIRRAVAVTRTSQYLAVATNPDDRFYSFIRRRMGESLPTQLALAPPIALPAAAIGTPGSSVVSPTERRCRATLAECCGCLARAHEPELHAFRLRGCASDREGRYVGKEGCDTSERYSQPIGQSLAGVVLAAFYLVCGLLLAASVAWRMVLAPEPGTIVQNPLVDL